MFAGAANTHSFRATPPALRLFVLWTVFAVFCQCAGWILSALGALNVLGYAACFSIFFIGALLCFKSVRARQFALLQKYRRRLRRPFPLAFAIVATLAIAGGIMYSPNNFDAHTYRTPRVLHWLAEGRW